MDCFSYCQIHMHTQTMNVLRHLQCYSNTPSLFPYPPPPSSTASVPACQGYISNTKMTMGSSTWRTVERTAWADNRPTVPTCRLTGPLYTHLSPALYFYKRKKFLISPHSCCVIANCKMHKICCCYKFFMKYFLTNRNSKMIANRSFTW